MNKILIVDDNPDMIRLMGSILASEGELRFATSGIDALKLIETEPPDIVLLDAEMPGLNGFEVCGQIKSDPESRDVPVIMVTSHSGSEFELAGFNAGAADFIAKPVSHQLLLARVRTHLRFKAMADELRRISRVDELTKLANRGHFEETIDREWRRSLRSGHPLSVMLIEIDHFGLYLERHGRRAADQCLRAVAQTLREIGTRPADLVARYGNHTFGLLLPLTPRVGAEGVARRVLHAIEALDMTHATSPISKHVTVSVGIGRYDEGSPTWVGATGSSAFTPDMSMTCGPSDLLESAEVALRGAAHGGRAQAWWLDITDTESPELCREIAA